MASTLAWKLRHWPRSISQGELAAAAALASRGYMSPVLNLTLNERFNLDLIPPTDLGALASLATQTVQIYSVRGNPSLVLVGLNCHQLYVYYTSLSTSSTLALVDAMKIGVEEVTLCRPEDVDMTELVRYGGDGRCRSVTLLCYGNHYISDECRLRAKQWASMMGWECQGTRGSLMKMWAFEADEDS